MNQRIKVTTLAGALIFFGSAHAEIYWYDANASPPLIHYTTPNGACYGIAQKLLTSYQAVSPQQHRIQALSLHAIDTNEYQCKITIYKRQFMWVPVIVAAPYSIIQGGENCLIAGRSDDNGFCGPRQPRNECNGSNPILGAFGNKYQNEEDGVLGSTVPIIFGRHYNHLNYGDVASMGAGWRNEYERKIIADDIDLSGTSFNPASVILLRQRCQLPVVASAYNEYWNHRLACHDTERVNGNLLGNRRPADSFNK